MLSTNRLIGFLLIFTLALALPAASLAQSGGDDEYEDPFTGRRRAAAGSGGGGNSGNGSSGGGNSGTGSSGSAPARASRARRPRPTRTGPAATTPARCPSPASRWPGWSSWPPR